MAIDLNSIKANVSRENEGDWIDIPEWPGVKLKVRGANYAPFQHAKGIVENKWARRFGGRNDAVPPDIAYKENARLYADHILLGWTDFVENGVELIYEPKLAREMLADPAFRPLHEQIRYAMLQVAETDIVFVEEAAKNLSLSSSGN